MDRLVRQKLPTKSMIFRRDESTEGITTNGLAPASGAAWDPAFDELRFHLSKLNHSTSPTKRTILSTISGLPDPLGWLSPFVISVKLLMQDLWRRGVLWDEALPPELARRWDSIYEDLAHSFNIRVLRWSNIQPGNSIELHGFFKGSVSAYAATVYVRVTTNSGESHARLLTSKARVAPWRTIVVPQLELCAAVLLFKLIRKHVGGLGQEVASVSAWSDSKAALSWLATDPSTLTPFVSFRVSELQATCKDITWRHITSQENPADIASRGTSWGSLEEFSLWWTGPSWLSKPSSKWPSGQTPSASTLDAHRIVVNRHQPIQEDHVFLERFSSLTQLIRIVAWCLRFNHRHALRERSPSNPHLHSSELQASFRRCILLSQAASFADEIRELQRGHGLSQRNRLRTLRPFLDEEGILRVGLEQSTSPTLERHPPILAESCHLSSLILEWAHRASLHGGATLSYSVAIKRAWILGGRE